MLLLFGTKTIPMLILMAYFCARVDSSTCFLREGGGDREVEGNRDVGEIAR